MIIEFMLIVNWQMQAEQRKMKQLKTQHAGDLAKQRDAAAQAALQQHEEAASAGLTTAQALHESAKLSRVQVHAECIFLSWSAYIAKWQNDRLSANCIYAFVNCTHTLANMTAAAITACACNGMQSNPS